MARSTQPWVGDRKVLVARTVFDPKKLMSQQSQNQPKSVTCSRFTCCSNVREYVALCVRDRFTGLFAAYPATDRSPDSIASPLRRFMGRRGPSKPVSLISDAANEFEAAANILGRAPTPSLPNRLSRLCEVVCPRSWLCHSTRILACCAPLWLHGLEPHSFSSC